MLSDQEISLYLQDGKIKIEPFNENDLESGNYRLHLGDKLLVPKENQKVSLDDISDSDLFREHDLSEESYVLRPGGFVLGQTSEKMGWSKKFCGFVDGRSTFARLGLSIHQSATFLSPGQGLHVVTLELFNAGTFDLEIKPGIKIGRLLLFEFKKENIQSYDDYGVYAGQLETTKPTMKTTHDS